MSVNKSFQEIDAEHYFQTANQLKKEGKSREAIDVYYQAIELDSQMAKYYQGLGDALAQVGELDEAANAYRRAIDLNPEGFHAFLSLGNVSIEQGFTEQALEVLDLARNNIEIASRSNKLPSWVYILLGDAFVRVERISNAIIAYNQAIEVDSSNARLYLKVAQSYGSNNQVDLAIKNYILALQIEPNLAPALNQLLGIYKSNKEVSEGVSDFLKLVKQPPDNSAFQALLGTFQVEAGNIQEAVIAYQEAVTKQPSQPFWVYYGLGTALKQNHRINEAIVVYQKSIEIQPNHYQARLDLADCLKQQGNVDRAVSICQEFLESNFIQNSKRNIDLEFHHLNQLEQFILTLALTEVDKPFFTGSMQFVLSLKGDRQFSCNSALLIAREISQHHQISFDKKFCILAVLSSLNSLVETIFQSWLQDFSCQSSVDQDIIIFAALNPSNFRSIRRLEFKNILSLEIRQFSIEQINNDISQKLTVMLDNLKTESHQLGNIEKKQLNNFLFVLSFMDISKTSSHLKTVIDYAHFLSQEVSSSIINILITGEFSFRDSIIDSPKPVLENSIPYYEIFRSCYQDVSEDRVRFIIPQVVLSPDSESEYAEHLLKQAVDCRPDIVIFFGGVLGSLILPGVCYRKYPTMYMQFNLANQPTSEFDIYIANGNPESFDEFINPERWRKHRRPLMPFPKNEKYSYTRVKSSPEFITIITVGDTLENRIQDNDYIDKMANVLKTHSQACWLLVGVQDVELFLKRSNLLKLQYQQGKVKFIGFDPDLRALYELCDIYAYPRHSGGGNGTRSAAIEGLPILCYTSNDAEAHFQGTSVKFYESDDEYFQYLENLILDEAFRKSEGEKVKSFAPHPERMDSCIKDFLKLCKEARESFYLRSSRDD